MAYGLGMNFSLVKFDNEGTELWEVSLGSNGQSQIDDGGEYFSLNDIKNTMKTMFAIYESAKNGGTEINI